MSLAEKINNDLKTAMKARDSKKLEALRAIKSALLLAKTGKDAPVGDIPESIELSLLQKLVKQRKESAAIFRDKDRIEMAEEEEFQAGIIEAYLPKQLSEEEIETELKIIIEQVGAQSVKDMGKVMGAASKKFAGKADNKTISILVKKLLGI
jgi:uncharacterized protein